MFQKRVLPIVYITQTLNYFRTRKIIRKIDRFGKVNIAALGILVDIPNHAPVQAEKIYQALKKLRNDICVPIVGFTRSQVSPESYYVLSAADRIYTSPTAIFNLKSTNYLQTSTSPQQQQSITNKQNPRITISDIIQTATNLNYSHQTSPTLTITNPNKTSLNINILNSQTKQLYNDQNTDQMLFNQALKNREENWGFVYNMDVIQRYLIQRDDFQEYYYRVHKGKNDESTGISQQEQSKSRYMTTIPESQYYKQYNKYLTNKNYAKNFKQKLTRHISHPFLYQGIPQDQLTTSQKTHKQRQIKISHQHQYQQNLNKIKRQQPEPILSSYHIPKEKILRMRQLNKLLEDEMIKKMIQERKKFSIKENVRKGLQIVKDIDVKKLREKIDRFNSRNILSKKQSDSTDINIGQGQNIKIPHRQTIKLSKIDFKFEEMNSFLTGSQAVQKKLADGYGFYPEVLVKEFPHAYVLRVNNTRSHGSFRLYALIFSPLLAMIFFGKVIIKYTIIFKAWVKAKTRKLQGLPEQQPEIAGSNTEKQNAGKSTDALKANAVISAHS